VKQLAYYYAVPHGSKTARITELKILNRPMNLPTIKEGFYLISYISEMGYCMRQGEGVVPIPLTEINAWEQSAELKLTHNEKMHIKKLSESFVSALRESSTKGAMPYYSHTKADVGSKLKDAFKVLNKK
jgi:hypothetical protein